MVTSATRISPMAEQKGDISGLLQRLADGDPNVEKSALPPGVTGTEAPGASAHRKGAQGPYPTAYGSAGYGLPASCRRHKRPGSSLALPAHFYAFFSKGMRWYLIDYAKRHRRRLTAKHVPDGEDNAIPCPSPSPEEAIVVDELLFQMAKEDSNWVRIVEMKVFADFTDQETADALGIPLRSMQRKWREARKWLFVRVRGRKC